MEKCEGCHGTGSIVVHISGPVGETGEVTAVIDCPICRADPRVRDVRRLISVFGKAGVRHG